MILQFGPITESSGDICDISERIQRATLAGLLLKERSWFSRKWTGNTSKEGELDERGKKLGGGEMYCIFPRLGAHYLPERSRNRGLFSEKSQGLCNYCNERFYPQEWLLIMCHNPLL